MDRVADLVSRAQAELEAGRLADAESTCRLALTLADGSSEAHRVLGEILYAQNDPVAALASFEDAARLDPGSAKVLKELGKALAVQGRFEDASAAFRRALDLRPDYVAALCHLTGLKPLRADDPDLLALERLARDDGSRTPKELIQLHFALAQAYEELGDYDRAFASFERANRLKRDGLDYDVEDDIAFLERIAEVFRADLFERFEGAGDESDVPILVVGMPRSGTSLVEQILASHPAVHGAGELNELADLTKIASVLSSGASTFPASVPGLREDDLRRLGATYAEWLQRLAPGAARVVDKNPLNFRYLGFLRLILPHARVIHCVRDPLDTCLSCYGAHFSSVPFSYDLQDLGRFHRAYTELMEHWHACLPQGSLLDIRYEEVVTDVEAEARRLLAYAGLDWDPSCLDFHSAERTVRTASFAQVRRPVYGTSVARWRRYASHLRPLVEALEASA